MTQATDRAFPAVEGGFDGMNIREYFAAMAMQGFIASYAGEGNNPKPETAAKMSVEYADALIKELNKNQ